MLLKFLKHYKALLLHKWYVFVECLKMGMPIRGVVHDWDKLNPFLMWEYACGIECHDEKRLNRAWWRHVRKSPHHWQYWVVVDYDWHVTHQYIPLEMPLPYIKEAVADTLAAGRSKENARPALDWFMSAEPSFILAPKTRESMRRIFHERV